MEQIPGSVSGFLSPEDKAAHQKTVLTSMAALVGGLFVVGVGFVVAAVLSASGPGRHGGLGGLLVLLVWMMAPLAFLLAVRAIGKSELKTRVSPAPGLLAGQGRLATVWERGIATLLDFALWALLLAAGVALALLAGKAKGPMAAQSPAGWLPRILAGMGVAWAVGMFGYAWMEGRQGAGPGKRLLGLRVVGADGRACGFWRAIIREMVWGVDGFMGLVGLLVATLGPTQQRLGDLAAQTWVVKAPGVAVQPAEEAGFTARTSARHFVVVGMGAALILAAGYAVSGWAAVRDLRGNHALWALPGYVWWNGGPVIREAAMATGDAAVTRLGAQGQAVQVTRTALPGGWLASDGATLWAGDGSAVWRFGAAGLGHEAPRALGEGACAFVADGRLAVAEPLGDSMVVSTAANGAWATAVAAPLPEAKTWRTTAVKAGSSWHLFASEGDAKAKVSTAVWHVELPEGKPAEGEPQWARIYAERFVKMQAFSLDGKAALLVSAPGGELRLLRPDDGWQATAVEAPGRAVDWSVQGQAGRPDAVLILKGADLSWGALRPDGSFAQTAALAPPSRGFAARCAAWALAAAQVFGLAGVIAFSFRRGRTLEVPDRPGVRYAGPWRRVLAKSVDWLVVVAPLVAAFAATDFSNLGGRVGEALIRLCVAGAWTLVLGIALALWQGNTGGSPGKCLLGVRALGLDLKPLGFWKSLVRELVGGVDQLFSCSVGLLLYAFTPRFQRLGDLAAGSVVVCWPLPKGGGEPLEEAQPS